MINSSKMVTVPITQVDGLIQGGQQQLSILCKGKKVKERIC